MSKVSKIDQIHLMSKILKQAITDYIELILFHVEGVEDRSHTPKGCNTMYVEDVEDIKTSHNRLHWVNFISCWRCRRHQILCILKQCQRCQR